MHGHIHHSPMERRYIPVVWSEWFQQLVGAISSGRVLTQKSSHRRKATSRRHHCIAVGQALTDSDKPRMHCA